MKRFLIALAVLASLVVSTHAFTGVSISAAGHDGLIVIVQGFGFQPGLSNPVVTRDGEVVFSAAKVSRTALIERGCGGYNLTEKKARHLLESWGSTSPLRVQAIEVLEGKTVVISDRDAAAIRANDAASNMLSEARVVYVLD